MAQQRQFQMVGGGNSGQYNDTTFTKIFVGGLAWETQRDTMRRYFEQFGEILEAVVIADKNTGRSKGYGFVTFKDPEAATRACQNPSPVIDGRRANCNLASLGAQKTRTPTPQHGSRWFRPAHGLAAPPAYPSSSTSYIHPPTGHYSSPYSAFVYTGYSQDAMYPVSYYGVYGGQQFPPYYPTEGSLGSHGMFQHNFFPFYTQYAQSSQAHGFGIQYPQMVQFPYFPQQHGSTEISSLPSSAAMATSSTNAGAATMTMTTTTAAAAAPPPVTATSGVGGAGPGGLQTSGTVTKQNSSTK